MGVSDYAVADIEMADDIYGGLASPCYYCGPGLGDDDDDGYGERKAKRRKKVSFDERGMKKKE
ncbi:hypothetical protein TWF730_009101 [Orbilia blumenaviensis]|uniref:Uncharacterized protein n=1 Tax=Orbilia blumenaviensis TaxID=1796055 RepID=A0AAV9UXC6_9PEZI